MTHVSCCAACRVSVIGDCRRMHTESLRCTMRVPLEPLTRSSRSCAKELMCTLRTSTKSYTSPRTQVVLSVSHSLASSSPSPGSVKHRCTTLLSLECWTRSGICCTLYVYRPETHFPTCCNQQRNNHYAPTHTKGADPYKESERGNCFDLALLYHPKSSGMHIFLSGNPPPTLHSPIHACVCVHG